MVPITTNPKAIKACYKLIEVLVNETIKELYRSYKSYITKNSEYSYFDFMKNDIGRNRVLSERERGLMKHNIC